jgi:homoserine O-acetyltransferase
MTQLSTSIAREEIAVRIKPRMAISLSGRDMEAMLKNSSVGVIETQYHTFAYPPNELVLENGAKLGPTTLAFETYGKLNGDKSNAILVLHALSGDAHAAGFHKGEKDPGWLDNMIGPGKAFDTDKYFVVCSNIIGGCKGSTGPSSLNPNTKRAYGLDFPVITIGDVVNAQKHLVDYLGIGRLLSVAGGSMGGMQVLEWMVSYPEMVRSAIPIATAIKHSPQQIAFNEVGRQAIMADPNWNGGNYYGGPLPASGLAVARMIGHITYMSDKSMAEKFSRRLRNDRPDFKFTAYFEVEGYLRYRGNNFVKRFDANSYLYITKAIDYFDASRGKNLGQMFKGIDTQVLVIAFKSDWLYPSYQSQEIVKACKLAGVDVTYCEIDSTYGHDAFLLETEEETHLIRYFLERVSRREVIEEYEI